MNAILLTLVCCGPPSVTIVDDELPERPVIRSEAKLDRDTVRAWYRTLASKTTKRARTEAKVAIPELVALHELVGDVEGLSAAEKERMKVTLRGRISWYGHRLRKQVAEGERDRRATGGAAGGDASLAGAYSLIDLIQRTVNPPIWDVNGGPAGIGYFAPFHALVVRAPGEIHYEIGGTLGQARRTGN